jgi:hypothetical protein
LSSNGALACAMLWYLLLRLSGNHIRPWIYHPLLLSVRGFDKAHIIYLGMHAQRGYKTNVRTFRCFDGTETPVVGIVYVTHLKTGTFWERPPGPSADIRRLWVISASGLVWSINWTTGWFQRRVDYRRKCSGVDQVDRLEILVVAYIHSFLDGAGHTGKAYTKLGV